MTRFSMGNLASHFHALAQDMPHRREEALKKVAEFAEKDAKERFGHYQDGWPQLAESTQAGRVAKGYSADEPLLRSGELRDSISHTVDDKAHIGTNDPRMAWFEHGTSRMPPRPVLGGVLAQKGQEMAEIAGSEIFASMEIRKRS